MSALRFHGLLNFYLGGDKKLDQTVFVFSSKKSLGRIRSGREGELQWFRMNQIPYSDMWEDDKLWLPLVLESRNFIGDFYFTQDYKELVSFEMHETE